MSGFLIDLSLFQSALVLLGAVAAVAISGVGITRIADILADKTGLGEALVGAVLLGAVTSLSGSVTSVTAAADGYPGIAIGNALGGIAAQTSFLAFADLFYRGVNLEHAAASEENLTQGAVLCALLAIPLLVMNGPDITLWHVHPATAVLIGAYLFGLRLIADARDAPMWRPRRTSETRLDRPDPEEAHRFSMLWLWSWFAAFAVVLGLSGFVVAKMGVAIVSTSGLSESVVGGFITSITTSLPELMVAIAAVRRGALTLAIGNVLGGNGFDVLFLAFSDLAYPGGSIYHAFSRQDVALLALSILLTTILLLGLLRRQKHGLGNIGLESLLVLLFYGLGAGFVLSQ